MLNLSNSSYSEVFNILTDYLGSASIQVNLDEGEYTVKSDFKGDGNYSSSNLTDKITVVSDKSVYILPDMNNDEIQLVLDFASDYSNIIFVNSNFSNISLVVNKPLNITGDNSVLSGSENSAIFTVKSDNVSISDLTLVPYEGTGIILDNVSSVNVFNNIISNILDSRYIYDYSRGYKVLPGNGIAIIDSVGVIIINNSVNNFENGVYLLSSDSSVVSDNLLFKNNYGINFDYGVSNTIVFNNNITVNVGNYTLDEPEGPLGYGIYLNNSANNVNISYNYIVDNYIGILIDSANSSGIRITSNLVNENALEGITFWKHYNLTNSSVYPVVEDNAIYNNAKGPSMMILGEMSANPEGIYGPGEWNDDLKLFIGPNWYGTNHLVTWDLDGTVGAGSMCPRIKTSTIIMNLTYRETGVYDVNFYKNGSLAVDLPVFTVYYTFNNINDEPVVIVNGSGLLRLDKNSFNSDYNLIEISAGPLNSSERIYYVIYNYIVPESEYP